MRFVQRAVICMGVYRCVARVLSLARNYIAPIQLYSHRAFWPHDLIWYAWINRVAWRLCQDYVERRRATTSFGRLSAAMKPHAFARSGGPIGGIAAVIPPGKAFPYFARGSFLNVHIQPAKQIITLVSKMSPVNGTVTDCHYGRV